MTKELKALERIKKSHHIAIAVMGCERDIETENAIDTIEQSLLKAQEQKKVLKIIIEKDVDIYLLKRSENWLDYYTRVKHKTGKNTELTEEEFDLLKRWQNE